MSDQNKNDKSSTENNTNTDEPNTTNIEEALNNLNENTDMSDILKNLGTDENISNLFKQFTSGLSNINNSQNDLSENDFNLYNEDDDDIDIDSLNLDKYFISSDGKNICDVLIDLKDVISKFNK